MVVLSLRPKRASSRNVPKCEERGEMAVLRGLLRGTCSLFNTCYNQLQKHLRHCTVFWLEWLVHDLVLVIPSPTLIKVASNTRPCSKLGGTTLNEREEGEARSVLYLTDLWPAAIWSKKCRFFVGVSQHFCNWLVVAWTSVCINVECLSIKSKKKKPKYIRTSIKWQLLVSH